MRKSPLFALALAGGLAFTAPALAQDGEANLPTCSAAVTDHCMQRDHHTMVPRHHAMKHHHHHARKHHAK
ncbi:MAG: hypothetical protein ACKOOL_09895 [Novosphingobium sp.]